MEPPSPSESGPNAETIAPAATHRLRISSNNSDNLHHHHHAISSTLSGEVNLSRDDSETGEEYFLPRTTHLQHHQQQFPFHSATTTPASFLLANLSLSPEYSQPSVAISSSPPPPPPTTLTDAPAASSLLFPRTSSQNSLVELLYGEEIVGTTTTINTTTTGVHHHHHHPHTHHPNQNIHHLQQQQQHQPTNIHPTELGSVSTNTGSMEEEEEDHHHPDLISNRPTTPTTPTTITPPSMTYPYTLSPPQLRMAYYNNESNNDNNEVGDDDETNNAPSQQQSPADIHVSTTTHLSTQNNNNTVRVPSPSSVAIRNSSTNPTTNRPPRAPQPPQYRPAPMTTVTTSNHNNNCNNNNNNNPNSTINAHSSSTSHNSSSSAMSSVVPTTPTVDRNPKPPTAQHYRAISTGDASILSALTADSGDYHMEHIGGGGLSHHPQQLDGTTTPNIYNSYSNISSNRSYAGLPTFRDSSLRGRGGTRSLSGASNSATGMNLLRQRTHSTNVDVRHDDSETLLMNGMDIDIPICLQQPILGENDNNHPIMYHPDHPKDSNVSLTHEQPILPTSGETDNSSNVEKIVSPDISPLLFHSVDPNPSLNQIFLEMHKENGNENERRRSFHHRKVPKMSEYETEAETAILAAIDEDVKRESIINNMRTAIFPQLSRDEEEIIRAEHDERAGKLEEATSTGKSTAFAKWYALQHTEIGIHDSIVRQPKMSQRMGASAMNSLTDNASSLSDKIQIKNSKRSFLTGRSNATSGGVDCNDTSHMSNLNVTNESIGQTRDNNDSDVAMDAAERGRKGSPTKKVVNVAMRLQHNAVGSIQRIIEQRKADWIAFEEFIVPQKETAFGYMKNLASFCLLPSLLLACILFYIYGNPPTGRATQSNNDTRASISWWTIFIGVRHPLVWTIARGGEYVFSNFLGASSPRFMKMVGPRLGLILAHSKGWPCVLLIYGLLSLQLLQGESNFVKHWLYWQSFISIFTEANPAGNITSREEYLRLLVMLVFVGCTVSVKRVCLGYYFGQRICARYSNDLHELLEKLLLLSEIATLSFAPKQVSRELNVSIDVSSQQSTDQASRKSQNTTHKLESSYNFQKLLEEWDEPKQSVSTENKVSSLKDILEFRHTVHLMQTDYPFSRLFGRADSREACVTSSTKVFDRLVDNQLGSTNLKFDTLAKIVSTTSNDGVQQKQQKLKRLITLFRPNKEKELSMLDFTRSVDSVYRELRTLSASISNATAIDRVFEMILNFCFYTVLVFVSFAIMGIGILTFAVTFSSTILALSFIIGSACSSLFEGLLMILARRPYDIGDRIALSNVDDDTDPTGSLGWIVEDIDIFYTTVRFGATREVATLSNGSIVRCRIINARRSDDAQLMIRMKFGIKTTSQQIHLFQSALEKFIDDRPQEYHNTLGFRLNTVVADLGYIEYMIIVQCRSSWQKIGSVLDSRAKVNSFCLELQKQLDMRYVAPPMPIDLTLSKATGSSLGVDGIASSFGLPRRSSRESGPTLQRKGTSRRDSDLVFSVQSDPKGNGTSVEVEKMVAQFIAEGKKDM